MKKVNLFVVGISMLVVIAVLPLSSPVAARSDTQSTQTSADKKDKKDGIGMRDDMSMCCRKKMMGLKAKTETQDEKAEPTMESMSEPKQQAGGQSKKEVKDPVCSMTVDPKTAENSVYKGKTYYFCSKADKEAFEKAPEKHLKKDEEKTKP